jgi:hypothetical protein
LGIKPNFTLWRYYFCATAFLKIVRRGETAPALIGSCTIQLCQSRADEYVAMKGISSNKGWHQKWFYLRSDADTPLPLYTSLYFDAVPVHWSYGPPAPRKEKINTLL